MQVQQKYLPFIWNKSNSNLGKSNSRSVQRKKVMTSSRPQRRGSVESWGGNWVFKSAKGLGGAGG